jgi:hypothetical protein
MVFGVPAEQEVIAMRNWKVWTAILVSAVNLLLVLLLLHHG